MSTDYNAKIKIIKDFLLEKLNLEESFESSPIKKKQKTLDGRRKRLSKRKSKKRSKRKSKKRSKRRTTKK